MLQICSTTDLSDLRCESVSYVCISMRCGIQFTSTFKHDTLDDYNDLISSQGQVHFIVPANLPVNSHGSDS